ncbi:GTP-binding protein Di-Ras2-like [Oscarella lobularis]|uniref:GTP-binding protein Di-Ras2-like n=1 Tax=Oscarella lobularis TaxID=121494 RepID=UPI003313FDC5
MERRRLGEINRQATTIVAYQIAILGDKATGKTALLNRWSTGRFSSDYEATVADIHRLSFKCAISGLSYPVLIFDVGGDRQFPAMYQLRIQQAQAFFLVFSVRSRRSFNEVKILRKQIYETKGDKNPVPIILVGNQIDEDDVACTREVSEKEARNLSIQWSCPYLETSARLGENVSQMYDTMLGTCREILGCPYAKRSKTKRKKIPRCAVQ